MSKTRELTMYNAILSLILFLVTSCSNFQHSERDGAPEVSVQAIYAPNPKPVQEDKSKYGNNHTYFVKGKKYHVLKSAKNYHKVGIASWYGTKFHGRLTSSREPYNMFAMTAASKELPIPCYVKVRNLENNRTAIVRVNDRGPFKPGRIMDLSYAAAQKLGMMKKGTAKVEITYINTQTTKSKNNPKKMYSLMLGSFKTKTSAQKLITKLKKYKSMKNSYIIKKDSKFVVMAGPLSAKESKSASLIAKKLGMRIKIS